MVDQVINKTQTLVPELIDYKKPYNLIYAVVDLKIKYIDEVTIEKFKAIICGRGDQLLARQNYVNETFSPTVSHLVHSIMLQLAIYYKMHMCSIDTVGAYLYQEYPSTLKPLYMKLPRDVAEVCDLDPRTTYRVKKYLYGLPDAG